MRVRLQRVEMRLTLDGSREEWVMLFLEVRQHACAGQPRQCCLTGHLYRALRDHVPSLTMGACDALTRYPDAGADP